MNLSPNTVTSAQVTASHEERPRGGCPFATIPDHQHTYTLSIGSVTGNTIVVEYQPAGANQPRASLIFNGTIAPDNRTLTGTLTWHRTDQSAPLDWTVTAPMTLTAQ
jgi:hypothetical protein